MAALVYYFLLRHMIQPSLLEALYHALWCMQWRLAQIILLAKVLHVVWMERNQVAWQGSRFWFRVEHLLRCVLLEMEALRIATSAPKKIQVLTRLSKILSPLRNLQQLSDFYLVIMQSNIQMLGWEPLCGRSSKEGVSKTVPRP